MIKLERERTKSAITSGLRGKGRIDKAVRLLNEHLDGEHKWNSGYWGKAKPQLKIETGGKCAYCEAPTDTVAHGDVEHFRPKSTYWWLAYCYDNYLYSCQICNQSYKSNKFPLAGTALAPGLPEPFPDGLTEEEMRELAARLFPDPLNDEEGHPMAEFLAAAALEECGLIDPYVVDPEPFFKWRADPVLKEVELLPRDDSAEVQRAFEAAEDALGLNREELRKWRWKTYETLETFKESYPLLKGTAVGEKIEQTIREMMAPTSPYAGMVRYFVREVWKLFEEEEDPNGG